jgi:hypothetical protein
MVRKALTPTGIQHMELKGKVFKGFNKVEPSHVNELPNTQFT